MDIRNFSLKKAVHGSVVTRPVGILLLILATVLAIWLYICAYYNREAIRDISKSLTTINSSKTLQIEDWLSRHKREAVRLNRHPFLQEIISEEMARPGSRRAQLDAWLLGHTAQKQYIAMALLTPAGAVIAKTSKYLPATEPIFKQAFSLAVKKGTPTLTDLYLVPDGSQRMATMAPLSAGGRGGKTQSVLVIQIDPEMEFYPLVLASPLFAKSAETLLVRREGEDVLFLNELAYSKRSALKLKIPLSTPLLPAAAALKGESGFYAGLDYRGEKVFSAINHINESQWAVITKIDQGVVLAPVKTREELALALLLLAALLAYIVFYAILLAREAAARTALKSTEASLRESEQIFREFMEHSPIYVFFKDENIRALHLSRNYETMIGKPLGELLGKSMDELFPSDLAKKMVADDKRVLKEGKETIVEEEFNGRSYRTIKFPIAIEGKPPYLAGYTIDITESKTAMKTLEKLQRLHTESERIGKMGGWELDIQTQKLAWTEGVYRIHELEVNSDLTLTNGVDFYAPKDRPVLARAVQRAIKQGEDYDLELEIITAKGNTRAVHAIGRADLPNHRLHGFFQDITERKRAEEALKKSEADKQATLQNMLVGVVIHAPDSRIVYSNAEAQRILGLSEDQMSGKDAISPEWQFINEDHTKMKLEDYPVNRVILNKNRFSGLIMGVQRPDRKRTTWISVSGMPQFSADGTMEKVTINFADITAHRQAEEELRASELALKEAQSLAKVGSWELDPVTGEGTWTDEIARIHDMEPGQPTNMALGISFYTGESRTKMDAAIKRAIEEGIPYDLDLEMITAKGAHKWVHTIGQPAVKEGRTVNLRGTFQDITGIKMAEQALKVSESAVRNKLDAIMTPEGDIGSLALTDIFDVPALQQLMDELLKLTKITSAILDIDGKILVASGWQDICTKFHRVNSESCRNCMESDTVLSDGIEPGTSRSYFCKNNMRDVATPIFVGGRHVANFFLGQFFYDDDRHDTELFRKQARRFGFDEKEYMAAYERVPVLSKEKVNVLITFYRQVMELISSLSYGKIKLARALAQSERAGDLLHENERRLAALFTNLPGIAYRCRNDQNWSMTFVSEGCKKLTGYEPAELVGDKAITLNEIIVPADRDRVWQEIQTALAQDRGFQLTYAIRSKGGELRTVWEQGLGVKDKNGNIEALEGFISDITERELAEKAKEILNKALIEKNQEMENFLYITTHDLRSPLVNIQGFSQNLEHYMQELREVLSPAQLSPETKEGLEKLTGDRIPGALKFVLESSNKMDALITALLKVSRLGRVEMKPVVVDMNELMKAIQASLAYQLKEAEGTINCGVLPPCKADPGAVSQLFTNLLDNAVKYRQEGRPLVITLKGETRGAVILYTVTDNGCGIPAADLPRIWNVFYRPEQPRGKKGEGIGLPMVKRIAEKNGGSIRAESKEGQGSVFYIELPASGEE